MGSRLAIFQKCLVHPKPEMTSPSLTKKLALFHRHVCSCLRSGPGAWRPSVPTPGLQRQCGSATWSGQSCLDGVRARQRQNNHTCTLDHGLHLGFAEHTVALPPQRDDGDGTPGQPSGSAQGNLAPPPSPECGSVKHSFCDTVTEPCFRQRHACLENCGAAGGNAFRWP